VLTCGRFECPSFLVKRMNAPPSPNATPRGFVIDRSDDQAKLPGSLHVNRRISQWLDFSTPGKVRVMTGKVELGQGILTALALIAAEELLLPLSQIEVVSASTAHGPDEGMTSGSLSVQDSGSAIRQACAEVRRLRRGLLARPAGGLTGHRTERFGPDAEPGPTQVDRTSESDAPGPARQNPRTGPLHS
jgi:CO/xanthine dehydrogenase Mo-binding subunit